MDATQEVAGLAVVVGGFLVTLTIGVIVVIRWAYQAIGKVRRGVHVLDRIEAVVNHELQPNHGSSMKDDITGIAFTVGNLWRRLEAVERDLAHHLTKRDPP